jgi:hypothetical protein
VPIPADFLEDERTSDVFFIHPFSTGRGFCFCGTAGKPPRDAAGDIKKLTRKFCPTIFRRLD